MVGLTWPVEDVAPRMKRQSPVVSNTGAVFIWYGGEEGFASEPGGVWGKKFNNDGDLVYFKDGYLGTWIAAGDMDGDGACGLARLERWDAAGGTNDGAVVIYRGSTEGLITEPIHFVADTENTGNAFGTRLDMGDVNGDGLADLLVSSYYDQRSE